MLFDCGDDIFESEKERNLYFKFFAGYFFNELIEGCEGRLQKFCRLLDSPVWPEPGQINPLVLSKGSTHVSFDNHSYQIEGCNQDRGEFSDVLIHDRVSQVLIAMEAKFRTDWNFEKDVEGNADRLCKIAEKLCPPVQIVQCLLLTRQKWNACKDQCNRSTSNFKRLQTCNLQVRVLLWEDVIELCDSPEVKDFFTGHVNNPPPRYFIKDGQFVLKSGSLGGGS